jgi:hypothetical protein
MVTFENYAPLLKKFLQNVKQQNDLWWNDDIIAYNNAALCQHEFNKYYLH